MLQKASHRSEPEEPGPDIGPLRGGWLATPAHLKEAVVLALRERKVQDIQRRLPRVLPRRHKHQAGLALRHMPDAMMHETLRWQALAR